MAGFSIALEGDRLVVGAVGDLGRRRRVEIPVAAIEGYCVEPSVACGPTRTCWTCPCGKR